MKTFKNFSFIVILLFGITSCQNIIDVQPPLDISNEIALSTVDGLQSALNASYALLRSGSLYGGNLYGVGELLGDQVFINGGGFGLLELAGRKMTFFNPEGRSIWQDGYGTINRINNIIAAMPTASGGTDAEKNRILGECLTIRAIVHFDLVRFFALPWKTTADNSHRGIPVRVEPTRGASNSVVAPSTVSQVYTQIVNDLNQAINILPEGSNTKFNRWSARAILARVLLQREDYQGAFNAADAVVKSGKFQLPSNVRDVFDNSFTNESIFEFLSKEPAEDASGGVQGYFREDAGLSPVLTVVPSFATSIVNNSSDKRGKELIKKVDDQYYTTKFQKVFMNMPILRYAEIILIHAESAARLNQASTAISSINMIRQRAGLSQIGSLSGDALLNTILNERAIELAFEGHRIHDLRRLQRSIPNPNNSADAALSWNDKRLVLQIPDIERNATPANFWD